MIGQTDERSGRGRQVFMTEQEKPVAIFLPQHRPGRGLGPSRAVMAAVMATVVILGGSLFFMMPRGGLSPAMVAAAEPRTEKPVRNVSTDVDAPKAAVAAATGGAESGAMIPAEAASPVAAPAAAPAAKAPRAVDIPRKDDPRWARTETRQGSAALDAMRKLIVEKAAPVEAGDSSLLAYAGVDDGPDLAGPEAAVRRPMQIVLPDELPEQPEASTRTASVNAPVNMRKGPGSRHGVMLVIPRRAKVEVYDCDLWCKVGYEGRTGYIYKSFVSRRS